MMRNVLLCCFLAAAINLNAQQRLTVAPSSGQTMEIRYDTAGSPVPSTVDGAWQAIVSYHGKNAVVKTDTLVLKPLKAKHVYAGVLQVPSNAVAFAVAVQKGPATDDNYGNGFLFPVTENGRAVPYSWYSLAMLKQGMYGLKKDQQQSLAYMKKEVANNPAAFREFRQPYFNMLVNSPEPADKAMLINLLLEDKDAGETDLTMAQKYLSFLGRKQSADSIANILTTQYPSGIYVRETAMDAVKKETDWTHKQRLFREFINRFPEQSGATQSYEYLSLYQLMALAAAKAGAREEAEKYIQRLQRNADKVNVYTQIASNMQTIDPELARGYIDKALAGIDTSRNFNGLEVYKLAAGLYAGTDTQLARKFSDIVAFHTAAPKVADISEQAIKAQLLNEKVGALSLNDINGNRVDIGKLKGKIVVLDFWATWCKPCIASFPAMQQVMARRPEVVFLYICTFEKNDVVKLVKNFAADHPFPFTYLVDEQLGEQAAYKAFSHYKVTSVPYKVIIDQAGNIRFRTNGFDGNNEELIKELDMMIRILQ